MVTTFQQFIFQEKQFKKFKDDLKDEAKAAMKEVHPVELSLSRVYCSTYKESQLPTLSLFHSPTVLQSAGCPSIEKSIYPSVYPSIEICTGSSFCPSVFLSFCLSFYLCVYLFDIRLSVHPSIGLFIGRFFRLIAYRSVHLSACTSIGLSTIPSI